MRTWSFRRNGKFRLGNSHTKTMETDISGGIDMLSLQPMSGRYQAGRKGQETEEEAEPADTSGNTTRMPAPHIHGTTGATLYQLTTLTCGNSSRPVQTLPSAGNVERISHSIDSTRQLIYGTFPTEVDMPEPRGHTSPQLALRGHDYIRGRPSDIPDIAMTRQRTQSTSSSSGVSSASEKSLSSSLYASVRAILDKRKKSQVIKPKHDMITEDKQEQTVVKISTKNKSRGKSPKPKPRSKSEKPGKGKPTGRGRTPVRRKRRVVALARGLGCVGGARSRSVTPERHTGLRVQALTPSQQDELNAMLRNVQQRVRNVIDDGRTTVSEVTLSRNRSEGRKTGSEGHVAKNNPEVGKRLSRWDRHIEEDMTEAGARLGGSAGPSASRSTPEGTCRSSDTPQRTYASSEGYSTSEGTYVRPHSNTTDVYVRHDLPEATYVLRQESHDPDFRPALPEKTYTRPDRNSSIYATVRVRGRPLPHPPLMGTRSRSASNTQARSSQRPSIQSRPLPPIPPPPKESSLNLVKTLDLSHFMKNSWISGMAVTRKNEIVIVDLSQAYVIDWEGNLKRSIANKAVNKTGVRLKEPIDVCVTSEGTLVFSDHADRQVKMFTSRGQHVRSICNQCHVNIAGVTCDESGQVFVAGTDSGCVSVYGEEDYPLRHVPGAGMLQHPYSVAINPLTGSLIVGDDYKQVVMALAPDGRVLWRYCPTGNAGERHFFPSSICVDSDGYIFIADLYNEKVYMLDSGGKYLKTLLSRGHGLKGGPGAIATDGRGHLLVADQEKTLQIFRYGQDGFALYRRFSKVPDMS